MHSSPCIAKKPYGLEKQHGRYQRVAIDDALVPQVSSRMQVTLFSVFKARQPRQTYQQYPIKNHLRGARLHLVGDFADAFDIVRVPAFCIVVAALRLFSVNHCPNHHSCRPLRRHPSCYLMCLPRPLTYRNCLNDCPA